MSRSRKKTPISGITTATSEKYDKRLANRRLRRRVRQHLATGHIDSADLPLLREVSNVWAMDKDGKLYFDPATHPKRLRK
ncbi:MAG: hypothetical protein AAFN13_16615 [Bacteroidota bacterium]